MKKNLISMFTFLMFAVFTVPSISAQFTINLPKIPKVKKTEKEQPKTQETTKTTDDSQNVQTKTSDKQTSQNSTQNEEMDFRLSFFLEEIAKTQKAVDKYTPADMLYLVSDGAQTEWLWRAVSPKERNEFNEKWKTLLTPFASQKFDTALNNLAASAANKLPTYLHDAKEYNFHNLVEEKMIKSVLKDPTKFKIYKTGLNQASWLIDKNDYGLPTARYKNGMIWLRNSTSDHPYCYVTYVNIVQTYSGGGTYGASYANYIKDEMVGCPTGK